MEINLKTNRLIIKLVSLSDLEKIHELHSLPETDKFNTLGIPENLNQTENIVKDWVQKNNDGQNKNFTFKLELIESKSFIGLISLNLGKANYRSAEVWFKINKNYWRKGYTTEALMKLLDFGFNDLKLHRIEAGCAVENIASSKTLEKVGMSREGMKRKKLPINGQWKDNYFYGILEEDFNTTD
ncbi:GNAT family N-acetyltransferase [Marivirga sp. S37H4]|uniref:GNAT family N-acetyltransferase n=1 Tax=Marivirga aurantiaca TaxID=2802615 RepID=A0A934X0I6_9BACT|nr:GNAT family protein [Marivirga aurantiaca]MBK6266135.1 GNAT family N-acetyltransferase [Marivirga aurantiaca]